MSLRAVENHYSFDSALISVIDLIHNANGEVYLVGGALRNYIINEPINDYDFEVYHLSFDKLKLILAKYEIIVNEKFGTIKIKPNIELSLPRLELSKNDGYLNYGILLDKDMSLKDASKRRDFSCNALMLNLKTLELIDNHNGIRDINNKEIRHINELTFSNDATRLLRALLLVFNYDFRINSNTLKILKSMAYQLNNEEYPHTISYFNRIFKGEYYNIELFFNILEGFFSKYLDTKLLLNDIMHLYVIKQRDNVSNQVFYHTMLFIIYYYNQEVILFFTNKEKLLSKYGSLLSIYPLYQSINEKDVRIKEIKHNYQDSFQYIHYFKEIKNSLKEI